MSINMADVIILLIIGLLLGTVVFRIIKKIKAGKGISCGCCDGCPSCSSCKD